MVQQKCKTEDIEETDAKQDFVSRSNQQRRDCAVEIQHGNLPNWCSGAGENGAQGNGKDRRTLDYIAGMTDRYALRMAEEMSLTSAI